MVVVLRSKTKKQYVAPLTGFFKGCVLCAAPLFVSFDEGSFVGVEKKRKETKRNERVSLQKTREGDPWKRNEQGQIFSFVCILCATPLTGSFEGVEKKRKEPLKEKGSTQKPTFLFFPSKRPSRERKKKQPVRETLKRTREGGLFEGIKEVCFPFLLRVLFVSFPHPQKKRGAAHRPQPLKKPSRKETKRGAASFASDA